MSGSRRWGRCAIINESTERQYALRNRAVEMMWAPERIRILDQDLGRSGAQTTDREDFKTLVADVSRAASARSSPWKPRGWPAPIWNGIG